MEINEELRLRLLAAQRNEISEYHIYTRIAASLPKGENRRILEQIAADELRHAASMTQLATARHVAASRAAAGSPFQVVERRLSSACQSHCCSQAASSAGVGGCSRKSRKR